MKENKVSSRRSYLSNERKRRNLTQQQVADDLGIHVSTYSNIETGNGSPGFALAVKIADYFRINERKLLK